MEKITKSALFGQMISARDAKLGFTLVVKSKGSNSPEHITNPPENITGKMLYIDKAYDDNLVLKSNPDISILFGFPKNVYHI